MKNFSLLIILALLCLGTLSAQEIKLSGEMWNRWTLDNGKTAGDPNSSSIRSNFFSLERGYLGLEAKFTDNIKGRFTADLFSTDALKDGAGLKLKYAYLDFANLMPVKDMKLTVGLHKVYFGTIYDWDYSLIGKAPTDEYKLASSADYGVSLSGYLPSGFGDYALGIYNGEGYKAYGDNLKDNINPAFLANLRLTPVAGLTLGASAMSNSSQREEDIDTGATNAAYQELMLLDGMARYARGPFSITAEYLSKTADHPGDATRDYSANGLSVIPSLSLRNFVGSDIQLIGRYDRWDETDNPNNTNLANTITAGINYNFLHDEKASPAMQLQLNYGSRRYDEDESSATYAGGLKDYDQLMLQLKWRFSNTIK